MMILPASMVANCQPHSLCSAYETVFRTAYSFFPRLIVMYPPLCQPGLMLGIALTLVYVGRDENKDRTGIIKV